MREDPFDDDLELAEKRDLIRLIQARHALPENNPGHSGHPVIFL